MKVSHGLPKYANILAKELQLVLHFVGKQNIVYEINSKYEMKYSRKVIEQENKEDTKKQGHKCTYKRYDKSIRHHQQEGEAK